ncbi:WD40 repeat domain-containing protein [bacterium]|nr:WD40 repeat domain-containing protein [bacterium]
MIQWNENRHLLFLCILFFSCSEKNILQLKIEKIGYWKLSPKTVVKLSYDAKQIAVIDSGQLVLVDIHEFKNQTRFIDELAIIDVCFSKDNKYLITRDSVRFNVFDREHLTLIHRIDVDSNKPASNFSNVEAFSDTTIYTLVEKFESPVYRKRSDRFSLSKIEVYDVFHKKTIAVISDSTDRIVSVKANFKTGKAVTLSNNNQIKIWNFKTNQLEAVISENMFSMYRPIISRLGKYIAYFDINNNITIWDISLKTKLSSFHFQEPFVYKISDNIFLTVTRGSIGVHEIAKSEFDVIELTSVSEGGNIFLQFSNSTVEAMKISNQF